MFHKSAVDPSDFIVCHTIFVPFVFFFNHFQSIALHFLCHHVVRKTWACPHIQHTSFHDHSLFFCKSNRHSNRHKSKANCSQHSETPGQIENFLGTFSG